MMLKKQADAAAAEVSALSAKIADAASVISVAQTSEACVIR
jgi:hypothetical protein